MNIELGSISGACLSFGKVESAVGSVASAAGRIVNEGPVGLADLKATVPLQLGQINPIKEIRFNNPATEPVMSGAESGMLMGRVEDFLAQARVKPHQAQSPLIEEKVSAGPKIVREVVKPAEVIMPGFEPQAVTQPAWENQRMVGVENALGVQATVEPANKQETETLVKLSPEQQKAEKKIVREKVTRNQIEKVESSKNKKRKRFVVDGATLIKRLREIESALPKAKLEAKRLGYGLKIIGPILEKLLVLGHTDDLSKIVRPQGPDGTLAIIRDAIKAKKEFSSKEEVMAVVLENRPVSAEEEGEPVSNEEVRKVTQNWLVKPASEPTELVEERISRKVEKLPEQRSAPVFVAVKTPVKTGATIEDLGLTEVFPKAA